MIITESDNIESDNIDLDEHQEDQYDSESTHITAQEIAETDLLTDIVDDDETDGRNSAQDMSLEILILKVMT